jgi:hypothetical protein
MTRSFIAVLSALLVAGASYAGGGTVKDKNAPTSFASEVGCTTAPVPTEPCPSTCEQCLKEHPCLAKAKDWLCFRPLRTCPCECKHCGGCWPPLYVYFLRPCVEGPGNYHCANNCASCVHNGCASCGGASLFSGWFHGGCNGGCETCK